MIPRPGASLLTMTWGRIKRYSGLGAGLLGLLFWLAACVSSPPPSTLKAASAPAPVRPVYSPRQILAHLKQDPPRIKSCRTLAHLEIDSWGRNKDLQAVAVLRSPASIRLEFLSFLGQPWQFVVCHQGKFWFYSPLQGKVMTGAATRFNLYRLLGVNLELEQMLDILLARPALFRHSGAVMIQYLPAQHRYLVRASDPETDREQEIWLSARNLTPQKLIIRQQRQLQMQVQWDDYHLVDSIYFPGSILIERPQEDTRLRISYRESRLNQQLEPQIFTLDLPPQVELVKIPD